jgi:hypothetical protein
VQRVEAIAAYAGFSFLLHFVWEMLQAPLFSGMRTIGHEQAIWICTRATAGDVSLALAAYGCAALAQRDTFWVVRPAARGWLAYLLPGLAVTLLFEYLGTGPLERWAYGNRMPTLPVVGTGLSPFLQWLVLPPLAAWLTARDVRGA